MIIGIKNKQKKPFKKNMMKSKKEDGKWNFFCRLERYLTNS